MSWFQVQLMHSEDLGLSALYFYMLTVFYCGKIIFPDPHFVTKISIVCQGRSYVYCIIVVLVCCCWLAHYIEDNTELEKGIVMLV